LIPRRAWLLASLPISGSLLGWAFGGGWDAAFALVGGLASFLGSVILAARVQRLRGRPPGEAMGLMMVNLASRFALVALGVAVLLRELTVERAIFYLLGFFAVEAVHAAVMLKVER